ncbi:DUF3515 family protein [Sanguibacter suaedae]|uniref:DUF3515 family protein n=1 Tax=Sanguibacter suaedae TaxID=2795737 RepID=UPI0027DB57A8|nr:DUF3515 family protein [Sanguibacter suaedae]
MPAQRRPRPSTSLVLAAALAAITTAGCAATISVPAGPDAANPLCARAVLAVPGKVAGQEKVRASGQATAAWGQAGAAVTLRCGVEPPTPTTEDCQSITVDVRGEETVFDWIAVQDDAGWTFVTYGREPAVSVQVPASLALEQPTAALVDLAAAVNEIPATRQCV